MPEPGSRAYDTQRARMREEFEDKGVPDATADEQANRVLQDEIGKPQAEEARPGRAKHSGAVASGGGEHGGKTGPDAQGGRAGMMREVGR